MAKNLVRLTESDLHNIIKESVKKVLNENEENFGYDDPNGIYLNGCIPSYHETESDHEYSKDFLEKLRKLKNDPKPKCDIWYYDIIYIAKYLLENPIPFKNDVYSNTVTIRNLSVTRCPETWMQPGRHEKYGDRIEIIYQVNPRIVYVVTDPGSRQRVPKTYLISLNS